MPINPITPIFIVHSVDESFEKPPKNLNRLRAGKGSYGTANIPIASLANLGNVLNDYGKDASGDVAADEEPSSHTVEDETTSRSSTSFETPDTDDLDEILAGDLDSAEYPPHPSWSDYSSTRNGPEAESTYTQTSIEDIARIKIEPPKPIANPQSSDTVILERLLSRGYDWRVRPPAKQGTIHSGPVVVTVNMLIRSISKIDNVNMEYSVQLTFRESWLDERLKYGVSTDNLPEFLILTAGQQIWMPDSFFQNEKQAYKHMIDKPNVLIRVHKDGTILYSVRISLVLSCPMHLQFYPMDVQQCFIDLASYAYTTKDIDYVWKIDEPVQLKQGLSSSLPSFQLNNVSTTYCTSITNTGTYSCLRTVLQLRRQFSYYLLQLYIPSCMLVIVSWVSFWIDRTAVPARVTLGVTTLLTMTTQSSGINAKLPPVAYIKAIDVWIGACLTFIFGALLEFAWVTYIANRTEGRRKEVKSKMLLVRENDEVWVPRIIRDQEFEKSKVLNNRINPQRPFYRWLARTIDWHDKAKRADLVSRLLFPLLFVSFNVAYWIHYAQYQTPT
ncbi:Cation transporter family protein [Teladorsagia circumcincta]|uniref:Cation transporter family protein n=1 Tax=Teladorsagia circumcincta TaxID=45464 RepID=A0A2G9UQ41_TELCI|nr:Cation transporter family protein [Teladorsagia circumcincta]